ncbi:unnamed protein product [Rotaria sp. Silwood1]|nr:unnamed protein product [Rotaria sp. Silwood1]
MADESKEDLDKFLSKIDDIHRIVQNLSSNDTNEVSKAMEQSDVLLKEISKTGFDRTIINKSSSESTQQQQQMSPNAFMSALEKDAQERSENRRKNKILADELKTKGNNAFHQQLYNQAIDYYTEGLKLKKDYDILYTNRAQVYVKQERYKDAIDDCNWALKITPTFIKAYIIKGKCLMNLNEYDCAKEQFIQAEEIAIKNFESINIRRMIEECIQEVQRQHEKYQREESARIFLLNEDLSIPMNLTNTLKKLYIDKQPIIYYIGGIDLLCQLIKDETTRTAFRINNGFNLFNSHSIIIENDNENLSESIFNLMIILCQDDDENTKQCLECKFFNNYLRKNIYSIKAFQFLIEISLKNQSRLIFIEKIIPNSFIQYLINIINDKKFNRIYAAKLLSNLAIESKIKQYFSNKDELIKLIAILKSSSIDEETRTVILSLLTNLCSEKHIRFCAVNQTELFQILIEDLGQYENEYELNLLGLLINLTNEQSSTLEGLYKNVLFLSLIYEQIIKSQNSLLIGNGSLIFGHIIIHSSARIFLRNNLGIEKTIGQMLKLVEESWLSKAARKNVAIFITKMVKADESFLQEFRKQHGTEILHSALKDVEL